MNTAKSLGTSVQGFGDDPLSVRHTDHYKHEYVKSFVEKWDALIDWEGRAKAEGEFFIEQLRAHGCKKVLERRDGDRFSLGSAAARGLRGHERRRQPDDARQGVR